MGKRKKDVPEICDNCLYSYRYRRKVFCDNARSDNYGKEVEYCDACQLFENGVRI